MDVVCYRARGLGYSTRPSVKSSEKSQWLGQFPRLHSTVLQGLTTMSDLERMAACLRTVERNAFSLVAQHTGVAACKQGGDGQFYQSTRV